jgi:hypothetical protein
LLQYVSINAYSVVANLQAKLTAIVYEFDFNAARARVMESVSQRFVADPVNLVLEDGRQVPARPSHPHFEKRLSSI